MPTVIGAGRDLPYYGPSSFRDLAEAPAKGNLPVECASDNYYIISLDLSPQVPTRYPGCSQRSRDFEFIGLRFETIC